MAKGATTRTGRGGLLTELILTVFPLNGRLLATGDRLAGEVGLTSALWQVMGALEGEPRSVPQIGRAMGLTRQSVQRSVNLLEAGGLVELVQNPDHKTSPLVRVTTKGRRSYQKVMGLQIDWSNELAKRFKAEDLKTAVRVLQTFVEVLDAQTE